MRYVLLILLALVAGTAAAPVAQHATPDEHATTVRLYFPITKDKGALCSGTVIGPHRILTAEHCLFHKGAQQGATIKVGLRTGNIQRLERDGNDHLLLTVDLWFPAFSLMGAVPKQGDAIHWWGNPEGLADMYRLGYVAGFSDGVAVIDANIGMGDSGAGIFDARGRVVGVVNAYALAGDGFRVMLARPLTFTPAQWAA